MAADDYQDAPAEGSGLDWTPRAANGGSLTPFGQQHLLAARAPMPPEMRTPNGGAPTIAAANVNPTPYGGPFGSYTGQGQPRPAVPMAASAVPTARIGGEALHTFMAQHAPQQHPVQHGGGLRGGLNPGQAEEGEAAEGAGAAPETIGAEAAGAGAAEGAGSIVEALGLL